MGSESNEIAMQSDYAPYMAFFESTTLGAPDFGPRAGASRMLGAFPGRSLKLAAFVARNGPPDHFVRCADRFSQHARRTPEVATAYRRQKTSA
jgi:hypothetical protein